ncbi:hypothetical protein GW17_00031112 [Ensete ventricosum]|nr:hypothetical protein GW17_00031112 [Ensete ventricosum]
MADWFFSSCKRPRTLSFDSNDPDSGVDVSLGDLVVERSDPPHDRHPNNNGDGDRGSTDGRPAGGGYIRSPGHPWCGGVVVVKYSKVPYHDFRQSMMEMVEANHRELGKKTDWDFMGRLLDRYLELNDRSVHDDIRRAFADLTRS